MSVNAISAVQKSNVTPSQTSFSSTNKKVEEKSNGTALLLGSLAALAIAGGIYFATRGKKAEKAVVESGEQIKDMAVEAFKKAGNKFERGKAKLANGSAYTGKLTKTAKNGETIVMEYNNGFLQKASRLDGDKLVLSKSYFYDGKGMLTKITDNNNKDIYEAIINKNAKIVTTQKSTIVTDLENGRLQKMQIEGKGAKWFYYGNDGKLKFVKHQYWDAGSREDFITYHQDGKHVRFIEHGNESAEFFDINGNQVDKIQIDMVRGGISYNYDGMSRSEIIGPGRRENSFQILDKNGALKVSLSKTKYGNYNDSTISISKNGKRYVLSRNDKGDIVIHEHNGKEITKETNKKLFDKLVKDATKAYKEIIIKHKKALRLKNELQLADREYQMMH